MGALSFHVPSDAVRPLRVYVTTTINTRIGVFGCHSETVASLKNRIVDDHYTVHADVGDIEVYSLRATLNEYIFVAPDEITLGSLCLSEIDEELHISADVGVATKVITRKRKRANLTEKANSSSTDQVKKTAVGVGSANCDKELKQLSDVVVETSSANEAVDCNKNVEQLSMDAVVETSSANAAAVLTDGNQTMSSDPLYPNNGKQLSGVSLRTRKWKKTNEVVPLAFESVNAFSEKVVIREQGKGSDDNLDVSGAAGYGQFFSPVASKENTFFPVNKAEGKDNDMGNADDRSAERRKESQKLTSLSASAIHQLINVATNPEVAVQDLDVSQLIEGTLNDNKIVQTIQLARIEEQRDLSKNSQTQHIMTRVVEPVRASNKRKKSENTSVLVNKIQEVPSFEHPKGISSTEQVSAVKKENIAEEMERDKLIRDVLEPFECINEDSKITEKKGKKPRKLKKTWQCDFTPLSNEKDVLAKSLAVTEADNSTTNQQSEKKSQSKKNTAADIRPTDHVGDPNVHAKVVRQSEMTNINDKSLPTTGETEAIINNVAEAGLKSVSNRKKIKQKVGTLKLIKSRAGRKAQSTLSDTTQKVKILLKAETKRIVPPSHKKLRDSSAKDLESDKIGTPLSAPQESMGQTFVGACEKLGKNKSEHKDNKMNFKSEDEAESLGSSTKIPSNALANTSVKDSNATYNIMPQRDRKMGNAADRSAQKRKERRKVVGISNKNENQAEGKSQSTDLGSTTQKEKTFSKIEARKTIPPSHKKLLDSSAPVLEKSVLNHGKVKKIVDTSIMTENQAEGKAQSTDSGCTSRKKNTLSKEESKNMMPPSSKKVMDSSEKGIESNKISRHVSTPQEPSGQTNADVNAAPSSSVISKVKGMQDKKENNNGDVVESSSKGFSCSRKLEIASKSEPKGLLGIFENTTNSKNEDEADILGYSTKAPSNALSDSSSNYSDATYNTTPHGSYGLHGKQNGERNNHNSLNLPFETILKRSGLYKRALEMAVSNPQFSEEEDDEVLPVRVKQT